jgi:hypothetical protein
VAYVRHRYQIVAIDVLLAFNLAVVFILLYFRFRTSKAKSLGIVLTNRQNAANFISWIFFLVAAHRLMTQDDSLRQ